MSAAGSTTAASRDSASDGFEYTVDFSRMKVVEYEGILLPQNLDEPAEIHVPKVVGLDLRDSDIFLLTYPKSGTHWLWRVLDMLSSGCSEYSKRKFLHFFLDLVPTNYFDEMGTGCRRIFNLHYPSPFLPARVKDGRVKVVHLYRNPKAVMVSMLFHLRSSGLFPGITFEQLEEMVYAKKGMYGSQFYYFDMLKEYERHNPNVDIFHLAYEDMKKDPVGCIKQLAAYLNVEASDELCSNIAEAVSINNQRQQEEKLDTKPSKVPIYRKGETDDWKNHMTVAQSERMDKVVADRAASCQFCRRYCPTITTDQGDVYRLASSS